MLGVGWPHWSRAVALEDETCYCPNRPSRTQEMGTRNNHTFLLLASHLKPVPLIGPNQLKLQGKKAQLMNSQRPVSQGHIAVQRREQDSTGSQAQYYQPHFNKC